jgi:hypothetical protein
MDKAGHKDYFFSYTPMDTWEENTKRGRGIIHGAATSEHDHEEHSVQVVEQDGTDCPAI